MKPKIYGIALWHNREPQSYSVHLVYDPTGDDRKQAMESLGVSTYLSSLDCFRCGCVCPDSADNHEFTYDCATKQLTFDEECTDDDLIAEIRDHIFRFSINFCETDVSLN